MLPFVPIFVDLFPDENDVTFPERQFPTQQAHTNRYTIKIHIIHSDQTDSYNILFFITWTFGQQNYTMLLLRASVLGYDFSVVVDSRLRNRHNGLKKWAISEKAYMHKRILYKTNYTITSLLFIAFRLQFNTNNKLSACLLFDMS